ncbi:MAG: class I SAM-dependent methyltransferase [Chloroflexi bacterium]|nr:class I SAM-dependent methyltransferase [Chloroflexota bacterium]MCL5075297.1 class I SAM-dependent methyltransferase [Chloroflexota bacterium]
MSRYKKLQALGKKVLSRLGLLNICIQARATYEHLLWEIELYRRHLMARRRIPDILRSVQPLNLELGGGDRRKPGWVNVDLFSSTADLTLDLRRPLPFPDECVDNIYSEHVLEHFSYPEPLTTLLTECFRVLKVGGVFYTAVPDFGKAFKLYAQGDEDRFYAQKYWDSPNPNWCTGPMDELNWLVYMGGQHRFMFDSQNIIDHLTAAGFSRVQLRQFDPSLDSKERAHQSIYVQASKDTAWPLYETVHRGLQNNDAAAYDALWANEALIRLYANPARRCLWWHLARIVAHIEGPVLDVGCGGGHLLEMLAQQAGRKPETLYGLDYSKEAVKQAKKRIPGAHLAQGNIHHLDFPDNYFNLVIACETLEHVTDPAAVLQESYRVLKPGGRLIVSIPNGTLDNWPGHAHFWDEAQFREFVRGYPIIHFEQIEQGRTLLFVFEKQADDKKQPLPRQRWTSNRAMHYTFCTLFDKNYLYKGLALYQSLKTHCKEFNLWILCMDDVVYSILEKMALDNVKLIALGDFEDDELRKAKQERTMAEYCWTCTPSLLLYVLAQEPEATQIAYLDADLFFYSDPHPIYDELGSNSILIIEHRFSPEYRAWESTSGIFNISMVIFKNDPYGLESLHWWRKRCLEACYLNPEVGQCGDQKYLDDWPSRFQNVVVLQHKGGGVAPWNIAKYQLHNCNGKLFVDSDELIFYHFHSLQILERHLCRKRLFLASRGYQFTGQQLSMVYSPYVAALREAIDRVKQANPAFTWGYAQLSLREILWALRTRNLLMV